MQNAQGNCTIQIGFSTQKVQFASQHFLESFAFGLHKRGGYSSLPTSSYGYRIHKLQNFYVSLPQNQLKHYEKDSSEDHARTGCLPAGCRCQCADRQLQRRAASPTDCPPESCGRLHDDRLYRHRHRKEQGVPTQCGFPAAVHRGTYRHETQDCHQGTGHQFHCPPQCLARQCRRLYPGGKERRHHHLRRKRCRNILRHPDPSQVHAAHGARPGT